MTPTTPYPTSTVVLCASGKGGTGKSSTACALGHALAAEHRLNVALVDLDPQASLTAFCGIAPVADPLTAHPVVAHGCQLFRGGIALAGASPEQAAAHVRRASADAQVTIVDVRGTLDDGGHTRGVLSLSGARLLVVPAAEPRAIPEARKLAARAEAAGVTYRVIVNRLSRRASSTAADRLMRNFWGPLVCRTAIPDLSDVGRAELSLQPVTVAVPNGRVAKAVRDLARELLDSGFLP